MVNFIVFDLVFLALLIVVASFFLYKNRRRLGKEGALILYRTSWGIKLIDNVGGRYKKTLKFLSYVSIVMGYFLMAGILWLFGRTVWEYIFNPIVSETIRAPPIAPLIPYFPQLFGLTDYFPVFYATYFVIAILIVMTVHEFSHGIFARRYGIKIKSTGFVFLKFFPAIFGAFVEQDDNQMTKAKNFDQMSVLSAGVFANMIFAALFFFVLIGYFGVAFNPVGVSFANYAFSQVSIGSIDQVNGVALDNLTYGGLLDALDESKLNEIEAGGQNYLATSEMIGQQNNSEGILVLYDDAPAIREGLEGVILSVDGVGIREEESLREALNAHSPGEKIKLTTLTEEGERGVEIVLGENPADPSKSYLGIVSYQSRGGIVGELTHFLSSLRTSELYFKGNVFYEANWPGVSEFFYYLFWWIVFLNLLVALFNMLPFAVLDGGRFFYLTILSVTKSEKAAERSFKVMGYLLLLLLIAIMVKWVFTFF